MELDPNRTIMDYIIEQASIYDGTNVKVESELAHRVIHIYDRMTSEILKLTDIYGEISTVFKYEMLTKKIESVVTIMYSDIYKELTSSVEGYMEKGFAQFEDLIDIGFEVQDEVNRQRVHEIRQIIDANAIRFMKNHAFERVTAISNDIMNQMRSRLGGLLAGGSYGIGNVRSMVQDIMKTNRSRADMIARTEMSMAYNSGIIERMNDYNASATMKIQKYWYGFKYSETTCTYCRPRIGNVYDAADDTEVLPAHPRCRCVWLPYMEGWDTPIGKMITTRANMSRRSYSPDELYDKINKRLGINYGSYIPPADAEAYIRGDRSQAVRDAIAGARGRAISDNIASFDIAIAKNEEKLSGEFNDQMRFWKKLVSTATVDQDTDLLKRSYEAVRGMMVLPWTGRQIDEWNKILKAIRDQI